MPFAKRHKKDCLDQCLLMGMRVVCRREMEADIARATAWRREHLPAAQVALLCVRVRVSVGVRVGVCVCPVVCVCACAHGDESRTGGQMS
jgi:hypothetical protein